MTSSKRWTIVEYGEATDVLQDIANQTTLSLPEIRQYAEAAGERIAQRLGLSTPPLFVERDRLRAEDVAGLVRISPQVELEIAPKFLADGSGAGGWREDFFYLATLSRYGRVLPSERLRSGKTATRDLPTLVSRAVIEMYEQQRRRPLRTYRHSTEHDFALDGDVDIETLILPSPDGFEQTVVRYDLRNAYNATIRAAAARLVEEVRNPIIKAQLARVVAALSPQQTNFRRRSRAVPTRARSWQDLYDLSVDVLRGFGLSYDPISGIKSPGYIVSTWRVWEQLLALALRLAFTDADVLPQRSSQLGSRIRHANGARFSETQVFVTPDVTIQIAGEPAPLLVDAKYKTRVDFTKQRIAEADIYEALAFARACGASEVVLLYPAIGTHAKDDVGTATAFESVNVGNVRVIAGQVEVRGIAVRGAIRRFASNLRAGILGLTERQTVVP